MLFSIPVLLIVLFCVESLEIKPELKIYNDLISLIPDSLMDGKIKGSLKDIVKFADKIFSRVDKPPIHPLPVNLALLRLYAINTSFAPIPTSDQTERTTPPPAQAASTPMELSEEFIAEASHYFYYANEAYNANPRIVQQDLLLNNLPDKDSSNINLPRHVVFLDHVTKSIVVSVRGTASFSDMITDLYIEPYPFLEPSRNLYAHHGMALSAEALLPLVTSAITEIRSRTTKRSEKNTKRWKWLDSGRKRKYTDYRVVVTGHSLGAGTASLLAILLAIKSNISATAYAYAPPPSLSSVGSIPHLKSAKRKVFVPLIGSNSESTYEIHSFLHNNDIISRSSHTEILSLVSALSAVDQMKWSAFERSAIILRNSLSGEELSQLDASLRNRTHFIDGNDRDLFVPGNIYVLKPVVVGNKSTVSVDRGVQAQSAERGARQGSDPKPSGSKTNASGGTNLVSTAEVSKTGEEVTLSLLGQSVPAPPLVRSAVLAASASVTTEAGAETGDGNRIEESGSSGVQSTANANSTTTSYYFAERVADPRTLFNGLMYYGDAMVFDHLTVPFERALLQLRSKTP